jgi:hypothetical protein
MGLWTSMDMFEVPLMGPWTSVGVIDGLWTSMDMFGLPLMGPWTSMGCQRWAVDIYGHVWVTINGSMDTWYGPGAVYSNPI